MEMLTGLKNLVELHYVPIYTKKLMSDKYKLKNKDFKFNCVP